MAPEFHDIHVGEPPVLLQKRKGFGVVGLLAGLIVIGGVSGLLWMNYDRLIEASSTGSGSAPVAATTDAEPSPSLADFQAFQQQTTQNWQSTGQTVETQQAEIKRLSEQVAALTARIEQLQQPAILAPPPRTTEPPRAPFPPRAAAAPTAPRKQPATAPRPSSSISVGGAPLPGAPPPAIR